MHIMRLPILPLLLVLILTGCVRAPLQPQEPVRGDLRVVLISDLNSSYGSTDYEPAVHRTMALIRDSWRPDLVLAAGDLIAGQRPSLADRDVRRMWAAFDSVVAAPLREAGIPFGFTVGNHDASAYPAHQRDRRLALEHWRDPARTPALAFVDSTYYPLYYSFRQGPLFVLVWDAASAETVHDEALLAWVETQLARPEATGAAHRWAIGHLPLYGIAEGRNKAGEVLAEADSLRLLLERNGVDAYLSGHQHAYYPGKRGALTLMHAGALGQGARQLIGSALAPHQSVTVADFFGERVVFTTYAFDAAQQTMRPVEMAELPASVQGFNGTVTRLDLPE